VIGLPPGVEHLVDSIYSPARQALAGDLAAIGRRLFFIETGVELLLLFAAWRSGIAATLRSRLEQALHKAWLVDLAMPALFVAAFAIVLLPFSYYGGFVMMHAFGLSVESNAQWFRDWAVELGLSMLVSAVVGAIYLQVARRFERTWPIIVALVAAPMIVFGSAIFPVFITPLFNRYEPLPDSPLTRSILQLASSHGIKADAVYQYDASLQTTTSNAFVSGLGPSTRIAIADNTLKKMKPDEVLYIVAHEMGHYVMRHLWIGTLFGWLFTLGAIAVIWFAGGALVRRDPRLRGLGDPAALPLIALLVLCVNLIELPAENAVSRGIEHAADAFAAANTHLGDAGVRAFARLGRDSLLTLHPNAAVVWYFYTHPPLDERIDFAARQAGIDGGTE
jgi:STE24 endopeptidase